MKTLLLFPLLAACETLTVQPTAIPTPVQTNSPMPIAKSAVSTTQPSLSPSPSPQPTRSPSPSPSPKPTTAPAPSSVTVPANANLTTMLNAAKQGTTYVLAKNANYSVSGTITLAASNVILNLNGSSLSFPIGAAAAFNLRGAHFEIYNGTIAAAGVFMHSYADSLHMHHLTFKSITYNSVGKQNGGVNQVYISDTNLATNNLLENLTVGFTGTVSLYFTADNFTLRNSTFAGSYGEYAIREEQTSTTPPHLPINALISGVKADNSINKYGKDVVGIRMGSVTIDSCEFSGKDVRVGQGSASAVGVDNPSVTIKNSIFHGPLSFLSIDSGANVIVDSCQFYVDATMRAIAVGGNSKAIFMNNILHGVVKANGASSSGLWNTTANPKPVVVETGTMHN